MKLHIGVDDTFGLIHSIETTAANVSDVTVADRLLHGEESDVWGDAGYQGVDKRAEHRDRDAEWHIAMRPGLCARPPRRSALERLEKLKASRRAQVEHPFLTIKRIFGDAKVRYRGPAKSTNRVCVLAALTKLMRARPNLAT